MPAEKQPRAKTLTLSLRLDPKTKFILDFVSRIKGQNITTVVERAIKETADDLWLGPDSPDQTNWSSFWDPNEGVRTLSLLANRYYPTTFDEDELKAFTVAHGEFFYVDSFDGGPKRAFVEVLWPKIEEYLEIWREKKSTAYWAAGEAMKADLAAAGLKAPEWPRRSSAPVKRPATISAPASQSDLDDDIPF